MSAGGGTRRRPRSIVSRLRERERRAVLRRAEAEAPPGGDRLTTIDLRMMERALRLARRAAAEGEVPIAAVLYRGTDVLAEAHNRREFHADPTGHAELIAIREAGQRLGAWRLLECTLAVTLEPCAMCAGALVNARVARLVYGAPDPRAGACESLYAIATDPRLNHRLAVHRGVYAQRSIRLLRSFFAERRRAGARSRA